MGGPEGGERGIQQHNGGKMSPVTLEKQLLLHINLGRLNMTFLNYLKSDRLVLLTGALTVIISSCSSPTEL